MRLINPIIPGEYRYPTITPFTIPDGHTYLKTLEWLIHRMKQIIDEIDENNVELLDIVIDTLNNKIDEINEAFTEFEGEIDDKLASVDTKISDLETFVNTTVGDLETFVNTEIGDLETFVNDSVNTIINNSIEVQDPVVAGLLDDTNSDTHVEGVNQFNNTKIGATSILATNNMKPTEGVPLDKGLARIGDNTRESFAVITNAAFRDAGTKLSLTRVGNTVFINGVIARVTQLSTSAVFVNWGYVPTEFLPNEVYFMGDISLSGVLIQCAAARITTTGTAIDYRKSATLRIGEAGYLSVNANTFNEYTEIDKIIVSGSYLAQDTNFTPVLDRPEFDGTYFKSWFTTRHMQDGVDFHVNHTYGTDPRLSTLAIHGGGGEYGSLQAAYGLAELTGSSLYALDGNEGEYARFHISSNGFDDPRAMSLVNESQRCISFHGASNRPEFGEGVFSYIGGLDEELRLALIAHLENNGFPCVDATLNIPEISGAKPDNICNQTQISAGVQIEMSNKLRRALFTDDDYARDNTPNVTQLYHDYLGHIKTVVDQYLV